MAVQGRTHKCWPMRPWIATPKPARNDEVLCGRRQTGPNAIALGKPIPKVARVDKPILQRATLDAVPAIRELSRAAYAKWVPLIGREPQPMVADYAEAVRHHFVDLLYIGVKLAALIEMLPKADHLLVENVAVSPAFQKRGYGRKLMAHAEQVAASMGLSEIRLYTNKLFAANLQLYCRLGYQVDYEEPFKGGFRVHMSKRL